MGVLMTILGLLGATIITFMYVMLERGRVDSKSVHYYAMNGIGAFMIFVSLAYDFDWADIGGIALEVCWVVVSVMGLLKALSRKTDIMKNL